MSSDDDFEAALARSALVAILRGVTPDTVVAIADALVATGFTLIEIPLNSPDALDSIALLGARYAGSIMIGAGTVLTVAQVDRVRNAGGRFVVSPNVDATVILATRASGLISMPGFMTPSEAFVALDAGANALKLFPADSVGPGHLKALRSVLPPRTRILPVGGIDAPSMRAWHAAGADGFGFGTALYSPGTTPANIVRHAAAIQSAWGAL